MRKEEIARDEQFLLFPVFSTHLENFLPFSSSLKLSSANSFSLEEPKIGGLGNGLLCINKTEKQLTLYQTTHFYSGPN